MAEDQVWAGVDVGKEHHWVCVVDGNGNVVLSRKVVNDEHTMRDLVAEIDKLAGEVSWTVDLSNVFAALLLTVLADAGKTAELERADELIPSRQALVREFVFVGRLGSTAAAAEAEISRIFALAIGAIPDHSNKTKRFARHRLPQVLGSIT